MSFFGKVFSYVFNEVPPPLFSELLSATAAGHFCYGI